MVFEIRVRASRKWGELYAEMEKAKGAQGTGSNQHQKKEVQFQNGTAPDEAKPATLTDLGVTRKESSAWQAMAAMPEMVRTPSTTPSLALK